MALRHKSVLNQLRCDLVVVFVTIARLHERHPFHDIVLHDLFLVLAADFRHSLYRINDEARSLELLIREVLRGVLLPFHFLNSFD